LRFQDLDFPGVLQLDLRKSQEPGYQSLREEVEEAWSLAPNRMKKRFLELSGTNFIAYRGLIFELYILKTLINSGFNVTYEYDGSDKTTSIDFLARKDSIEFLIEVTTLGPNENGILNPSFDIYSEGFLKIRDALKSKLHKVAIPPRYPTVLAISNSYESFISTPFEKIQTLYGVPAVRINLDSNESSLVLADKGIWAEEPLLTRGYSAAYFTRGKYPGLSYLGRPELWLNPSADIELKVGTWPEDATYFKSDENLYRTTRDHNYEWTIVNNIFLI
jgi:hypothetical protein